MGTLLAEEMKKRIMVLDGAMGTMIQTYKFEEEDFQGKHNLGGLYMCVCVCMYVCVHAICPMVSYRGGV